ncbi:hypothetical protein FH972_024082 [Carpinus fangiana]|uniref:Amidase domain-containing protein n=1 Tax=Carpinus fangiana TaxID=176857 RepID=A0A5N6KZH6_9ROSI|nr:hypothetical protein FH972_024082 [Carpinus fangiana]
MPVRPTLVALPAYGWKCFSIVVIVLALLFLLTSSWTDPPLSMARPALFDVLTADLKMIQLLLSNGSLTSVDLLDTYLAQATQYDHYLNVMLSTPPYDKLMQLARNLDDERSAGKTRGPLHGIPIIIKDNIATHIDMGMNSSAGSLAFLNSRPKANAKIVDMLIAAGVIILGKANLSVCLSNMPVRCHTYAYTARNSPISMGGQTQSAYVRGGLQPGDSKDGHSSPSGSSTGPAVGVSAGYAPASIGTETDGSLVCPAGRAALYTIKPTIGLVPTVGIVPVSHSFDSPGPMTKTPYDLTILLDAIVGNRVHLQANSYSEFLTGSWADVSVGTLDPKKWVFPSSFMKPVDEATLQINSEIQSAYAKIKDLAKTYVHHVPLIERDSFLFQGKDSKAMITQADFHRDMNEYLSDLELSSIRNLHDLIAFNKAHADQEIPPGINQRILEEAFNLNLSAEQYDANARHLRNVAKTEGIDKILDSYGLDVIIGPIDSFLSSFASGTGYLIATMPLSYLKYNGRPFGLAAIAKAHREDILIKVQSAWEVTFGPRQPPPALCDQS